MTKQYLKFEDFKREFLLEASKKKKFPGGVFWSVRPDPEAEDDKKRGVVDVYIPLDKKQNKNDKHGTTITTFLKNVLKQKAPADTLKFKNSSGLETLETITHKFEDDYELKRVSMPFTITSTDDPKNSIKKIKQFFKSELRKFIEHAKVYTTSELKDVDGSSFDTRQEDEDKVIDYIDDMINNPDKFGGYKTLAQRLDEIGDMSTAEFVKQYSSEGPIEAWIAKKIFDGINYFRDKSKEKKEKEKQDKIDKEKAEKEEQEKRSKPPVWNYKFENFSVEINKEEKVNLVEFIDNYDLHKDDITISVSPESDYYKINGTDFECQFMEQNDFTLEFKLECKDFSPSTKTIEIHVKGIGESIVK